MGHAFRANHGSAQESPGKEKALREKLTKELRDPLGRKPTDGKSKGISGRDGGEQSSRNHSKADKKPQTVRKYPFAPPSPKVHAKMLKRGILLAVVLTIVGVTYRKGYSKDATLLASSVDQV